MSYSDDQLRGGGGWLALLVIILAVFTPLRVAIDMFAIYSDPTIAAAFGSAWPAAQAFELTLAAVNVAGALYMAWRLNSVHEPKTVRIVIAGLWLLAVGLAVVEILAVSVLSGVSFGVILAGTGADLVRGVVFATIWTAYLLRSRRVANTYAAPDEEVSEVFA